VPWNPHWDLEGKHAYLSPSKFHWIRYDLEKLRRHYAKHRMAQEGAELHNLAKLLILKRKKQIRDGSTFNTYVNDAIGFHMTPEQPLRYSDNFFGTPDAISFRENILRVHDLKTGEFPGHFDQLKLYVVLFFLEYGKIYRVKPHDVEIYIRIYQSDQILEEHVNPDEIVALMEWAKVANNEVDLMKGVMM